MKLYQKLGDLRKEKGLSQEDLAEALNVSRQTISKWETGVTAPSSGNLTCLSRVLGVSMDELMHGKEPAAEAKDAAPEKTAAPLGEKIKEKGGKHGRKRIIILALVVVGILAVLCLLWTFFGEKSAGIVSMNTIEGSEVETNSATEFEIEDWTAEREPNQ